MQSRTHVAVALALATAVPWVVEDAAAGRPWLVLLAVTCAVLPDLLERGLRRSATRPDLVVALDPLAPDAAGIAEGVAAAATWALVRGTPCWLRILPLPASDVGPVAAPQVRFDAAARRVFAAVREGGREAEAGLPAMVPGWPDRYSVEAPEGLLLRFWPGTGSDPRVRCTVLERGWPHGAPFAVAVSLGLWVGAGAAAAGVAALVLAAHLLLDQGGLLGVAWSAPFGRKRAPFGWRLWRGASPSVNGALTWVAALVAFWNVAQHTEYLPWRPSLFALLVVGFVVPALAVSRFKAHQALTTKRRR